jgi:hypothetical protein
MRDLVADLRFRARSLLRWSPRPREASAVELSVLRGELSKEGRRRFDVLSRKYDLAALRLSQTLGSAREALWALDVLDTALPRALPAGRCLDVGAKNGALTPGLVTCLPRGWDLVELDAHRRYADLTTRRAHGAAVAARFVGCRYIAGDVLTLKGSYAAITWFLPFVVQAPLSAWGLPRRFFMPGRLLAHVTSLLAPGGALFIVNQGDAEAAAQRALLEEAAMPFEATGALPATLSPYARERFGFVVRPSVAATSAADVIG